eukprot:g47052.t1
MEYLQELKSQQGSLFALEASKIIFQSRICTVEQDDMCSGFFFQKAHGESSVLSSPKEEDGSVMSSQSDILRFSKSFCARLCDTKPTNSTPSQSFLSSITEVLDDSAQERLEQLLSLDELSKAPNPLKRVKLPEMTAYLTSRCEPERVTIPGSRGLRVKVSMNMDDIVVFCLDLPTHYLNVLSIWLKGAGTCVKTWEERIAKMRQKLSSWEHLSQSITGKNLVIRSKIDDVGMDIMYEALDNGRKGIPNAAIILVAIFMCGGMKLFVDPRNANTKCHYVLKFYLSLVLQRTGLVSLAWNAP